MESLRDDHGPHARKELRDRTSWPLATLEYELAYQQAVEALTKRAESAEARLARVAGLVERWRTRMPANAPDTSRVLMREWCADELAAAIAPQEGER